MSDDAQNEPNLTRRARSNTIVVFALAIIFLTVGLGLSLAQRRLDIDPTWVLLIVPFSLSITGALILFYFLSSAATISRDEYKVGGAIAGFLVLFSTFYYSSRQSYFSDPSMKIISDSPLSKQLRPLAERYRDIAAFKNDTMNKIADASLQTVRTTFEQLANGTYFVDADELPTHLLPMIKGAKKTYFATQFVFPEKFWGQYWAPKYFDENVAAVRDRNVELMRVFIIDSSENPEQRKLLNALIKKHLDNKIPIRLIETKDYLKAHFGNDDDLRDILIVDGQLSGFLLLNKGGSFNKVEFSVDRATVEKRQRNFDRLLASSLPYEEWMKTHDTQ